MLNTFLNTWQGQNLFSHPGNSFVGAFNGTFSGSGAGLTGLPSWSGANTWTGISTFSNASNSFTGGGAGLTNLTAANISPGMLAPGYFLGSLTSPGTNFGTSGNPMNFVGVFSGDFFGTLGNSGAGNAATFYGSGTFGYSGTPATLYGSGVGYSSSSGGTAGTFYGVFNGSNASNVVSFIGLATAAQTAGSASTVTCGGILSGQWEAATFAAPASGTATFGTAGNPNCVFFGVFTGVGTGQTVFSGDGSGLSSLNPAALTYTGTNSGPLPWAAFSGMTGAGTSGYVLTTNGSGVSFVAPTGGGSGTVTSVGLTAPDSIFTVSGSPITNSGTLALSLADQDALSVFCGPASGGSAAPTFQTSPTFSGANLTDLNPSNMTADGDLWLNGWLRVSTAEGDTDSSNIYADGTIYAGAGGSASNPGVLSTGYIHTNGYIAAEGLIAAGGKISTGEGFYGSGANLTEISTSSIQALIVDGNPTGYAAWDGSSPLVEWPVWASIGGTPQWVTLVFSGGLLIGTSS
jgi:hypothetical protein